MNDEIAVEPRRPSVEEILVGFPVVVIRVIVAEVEIARSQLRRDRDIPQHRAVWACTAAEAIVVVRKAIDACALWSPCPAVLADFYVYFLIQEEAVLLGPVC